jgi:hypothetical protein
LTPKVVRALSNWFTTQNSSKGKVLTEEQSPLGLFRLVVFKLDAFVKNDEAGFAIDEIIDVILDMLSPDSFVVYDEY